MTFSHFTVTSIALKYFIIKKMCRMVKKSTTWKSQKRIKKKLKMHQELDHLEITVIGMLVNFLPGILDVKRNLLSLCFHTDELTR